MGGSASEVTRLLDAVNGGDGDAMDKLLSVIYDELRAMARARVAHLRPGQTLQATALVHEAYLKLADRPAASWDGRAHFFGAAARAMRDILVDEARRKNRLKRGGDRDRVPFDEQLVIADGSPIDLVALDEALRKLEASNRQRADVVMLRYFAGLSIDRTAEVMGISTATVERHWAFARAWLHRELDGSGS